MTDNIEDRADDLQARLMGAGSPDDLVGSLARGLKRQGRAITITAISVAFDIVLSVILAVVVLVTNDAATRSSTNSVAIAQVVHAQQMAVWNQCQKSMINTTKINTTDLAFVKFLQSLPKPPTVVGQVNLLTLEKIYTDAVLTVPVCGPQPQP